ncbi:hypothetical protein NQT62_03240 [Limnobacter humi]|uniref:DUF6795 domain-containing protein n=1 Tax=Limnobacter humi TaxID=1778671 RepID=A0ABT1WD51_9BURK|nr:DUF6795 domain-containing protein [Limnobacter humi]MCQ8895453.1 hypothetical protein [Limnobacter humi]
MHPASQYSTARLSWVLALTSLVLLALPFRSAEAFLFKKYVYCSPMIGKVHWAGKPLQGLTIKRNLKSGGFKGGRYDDETITDSAGHFELPVVEHRRLATPDFFSANPQVSQSLKTTLDGMDYYLWSWSINQFELGAEGFGNPMTFDCDLSVYELIGGSPMVKCTVSGKKSYE